MVVCVCVYNVFIIIKMSLVVQFIPKKCIYHFRRTILEDGTLRIANVTKSDAGRYTCVARNPFGTSSSSGTLVVKGKTPFTFHKQHISLASKRTS